MSSYVTRTFKKICSKHLRPLGFSGEPKFFYRVINDVLQYIDLNRFSYGHGFHVFFGVIPLCMGLEFVNVNLAPRCLLPLSQYIKTTHFAFEHDTKEDAGTCMAQVEMCVEKHLIPFFERTIDCASAYEEIRLFDETYLPPKYLYLYLNKAEMYMLLKSENYTLAQTYAENIYKHVKKSYEKHIETKERHKLGQDEEYNASMERKILFLEELGLRLSNNDFAWIKELLAENERKSRITLGLGYAVD